MANCAYHPDREPVGGCSNCGKLICSECKVLLGGKVYCNPCADALVTGGAPSKGLGWVEERPEDTVEPLWVDGRSKTKSGPSKVGIAILVIIVLGVVIALIARSTSVDVVKPAVTAIPRGWYLSDEGRYGTYREPDGTKWGMVQYTDPDTYDFAQIFYGDVPSKLINRESDLDALTEYAMSQAVFSDAEEVYEMTIAGRRAAVVRAYDSVWGVWDMKIVFVYESTCIDVYACYDPTDESEENVMSLIESITFDN